MTNAALASSLNSELGLTGDDAVTVNVIRQWIGWRVLPRATANASVIGKSPEWRRDDRAYRTALKLARARKAGVRRETAVISQAWLEWGYDDIERARAAIIAEYVRARERLLKRLSTSLDFGNYAGLSATRKRAIRTQSGPLDDRFKGSPFELSPELYATVLQAGRDGSVDLHRISALIRDAVNRMVPSFSALIDQPQIEAIAGSYSGVFGQPNEIEGSVQENLQSATHEQLRKARRFARRGFMVVRLGNRVANLPAIPADISRLAGELASLSEQIIFGEWPISMFGQSLQMVLGEQFYIAYIER